MKGAAGLSEQDEGYTNDEGHYSDAIFCASLPGLPTIKVLGTGHLGQALTYPLYQCRIEKYHDASRDEALKGDEGPAKPIRLLVVLRLELEHVERRQSEAHKSPGLVDANANHRDDDETVSDEGATHGADLTVDYLSGNQTATARSRVIRMTSHSATSCVTFSSRLRMRHPVSPTLTAWTKAIRNDAAFKHVVATSQMAMLAINM